MGKPRSSIVVAMMSVVLMAAACGSAAPDVSTPTGGVSAAFETARTGGLLKQMDFFACVYSGGQIGGTFSGFLAGLSEESIAATGVDPDEFLAAFSSSFADFTATEVSRSGDRAVVHVSVNVTLDADMGKLRDVMKRYAERVGVPIDDATIDAALSRQVGSLPQTALLEHDVDVIQRDGTWHACDGTSTAIETPRATQPPAAEPSAPSAAPSASSTPSGPTGPSDAVGITAGDGFACALLSGGDVKCWGTNSSGQLGNGSTSSSDVPTDVAGLADGATAIDAFGSYACAVTSAAGVRCWGRGAVGSGSTSALTAAADVTGLTSGISAISTGLGHACALRPDGAVTCWGNNADGQLGNDTTVESDAPVLATVLDSRAVAVSAGGNYTCVITSEGGVKCWGGNTGGQLGNGSTTTSTKAVDVVGLTSGVKAITAGGGAYTCALTQTGGVKCWGGGKSIPIDVPGLESGVSAVTSLAELHCALLAGAGVKCWLGIADAPSDVQDLPGLTGGVNALAIGGRTTLCALLTGGGVSCVEGEDWIPVSGLTATAGVPAASGVAGNTTEVTVGFQHSCAVSRDGALTCWGQNGEGQLGTGAAGSSETPVAVFGLTSGITAVSASFSFTCAVTDAGGLKCWGRNSAGQLGNGTTANSLIPVDVSGAGSGVRAIALGDSHACALTIAGAVSCWGDNGSYQLGDGTGQDSLVPIAVGGLAGGVKAIAAEATMTCALTAAGGVKCWGTGVTGNGLPGNAAIRNETAADVVGLTSGVTDIAMGSKHACALMSVGGVKCWGVNGNGELGNGSTASAPGYGPVDVVGHAGAVSAIAVGSTHTCVIADGGAVRCWGDNRDGQLGNGTTASSVTPVDVAGLPSGIVAISAGHKGTCAVTNAGSMKCWGSGYGTTPVDVAGP